MQDESLSNFEKWLLLSLAQIYGELNRIRLIIGSKSEKGKHIEQFDKECNKYFPFFDSEKAFNDYGNLKGDMEDK